MVDIWYDFLGGSDNAAAAAASAANLGAAIGKLFFYWLKNYGNINYFIHCSDLVSYIIFNLNIRSKDLILWPCATFWF